MRYIRHTCCHACRTRSDCKGWTFYKPSKLCRLWDIPYNANGPGTNEVAYDSGAP